MIDPLNITKYDRSQAELEELALFATLVAGKASQPTARRLDRLLTAGRVAYGFDLTPFEVVREWLVRDILEQVLKEASSGQYTRLVRCWRELTGHSIVQGGRGRINDGYIRQVKQVNLGSVAELEAIHGIGPKTARLIVLHSVRGVRAIPIDTHWIKELQARGYPIVTTSEDGVTVVSLTPASYRQYEQYALAEVDKSGLSPAAYDLLIWKKWHQATTRRAA